MANYDSKETRVLAFTNTANVEENFGPMCTGVYLYASANVYVDFDQPCDAGSLYIAAGSSTGYIPIYFNKLHAKGVSGSGSLYILALRQSGR
jgi:uncharacterized protein (DUF488 family)